MIFPPKDSIKTMVELANMGKIRKVIRLASKLEEDNPAYSPFTHKIREFAESFDDKSIIDFLNQNK